MHVPVTELTMLGRKLHGGTSKTKVRTRTIPAQLSFVLKVPLHNLRRRVA